VNDAERCLSQLLLELESPAFDTARVEIGCRDLAASLSALAPRTPRVALERIQTMHAALRELVQRRHAEVARSLDFVVQARARCSRLTRPHDARTAVDLDA
jgi:hypothetical protein